MTAAPGVGPTVDVVVVTDVGKGGGEGGKCSTGILGAKLSGLGGGGGSISSAATPPTLTLLGCDVTPLEIDEVCATL